jgi:hypothetical protein
MDSLITLFSLDWYAICFQNSGLAVPDQNRKNFTPSIDQGRQNIYSTLYYKIFMQEKCKAGQANIAVGSLWLRSVADILALHLHYPVKGLFRAGRVALVSA